MEQIPGVMECGEAHDIDKLCWNPEAETMPMDQLRDLQIKKLKRQIPYLQENSEFYQTKFKEAGFDYRGFRDLSDLDAISFTRKSELRQSQEEVPPFGRHVAAPLNRIIRVTTTAGTTGRAVVQAYTRRDVMLRDESICRFLWGFGVRPGDRVINGCNLSMFNAGIPFCTGIERMGAVNIPVGTERKAEGLLRIAKDLSATVLLSTPSFASYLSERCEDVLGIPPSELGFRIVCGGGEPGFELPGKREQLEEAYGTKGVFDLASSSDAHPNSFANCHVRSGKHHITGDLVMVQLINPATGKTIEIADGVEGEYIFTHLDRGASPLLRYRTNDIVRVHTSPCECGRSGFRIELIGRSDDMLLVRGMNVFPSAVQSVVSSFSPKTTGKVRIILDRLGPAVEPPLNLEVECARGVEQSNWPTLKKHLDQTLREKLNVRTNVTLLAYGGIEQTATKSKIVVVKGNDQ